MAVEIPVEEGFPFRSVTIYTSEPLGRGAYGYVCKGKCDKLPIAAKQLHSIFLTIKDPGSRDLLSKFEKECKLLSNLSHPNIVQFIGVCKLSSGEPVLLTELMDESLLRYIARSRDSHIPVPLHTKINIMYDIALALSYLHSKQVLHRDLSSNNVLLAGTKAKVTDFGVARLHDIHSQQSRLLTRSPGTPPFMSPEASLDSPQYTDKLDVFSWAVVCLHLLSGREPFPSAPTSREIDSGGREIFVRVPERVRRQGDISAVESDHLLLPLTLHALSDDPFSRPTADELCDRLENLKLSSKYVSSFEAPPTEASSELRRKLEEKEREILELGLELDSLRGEKLQMSAAAKEGDYTEVLKERVKSLQLENTELREKLKKYQEGSTPKSSREDSITSTTSQSSIASLAGSIPRGPFNWETRGEAPCHFTRGSIVTQNHMIYISRPHSTIIHSYNTKDNTWSTLKQLCPVENFTLVYYTGTLVAVGGSILSLSGGKKCSNLVFTLIHDWESNYIKRMNYPRAFPAVVASNNYLVVAGGLNSETNAPLESVEVYDNSKSSWFYSYSLPTPLEAPIAVLNGDDFYLVGGVARKTHSFYIYSCSLHTLVDGSTRLMIPAVRQIWKTIYCPVASPSAVVVNKQLYLIGGIVGLTDSYPEFSCNVFKYRGQEPNFSIFVMPRSRGCGLATGLPNGRGVFVVGGCGSRAVDIGIINKEY